MIYLISTHRLMDDARSTGKYIIYSTSIITFIKGFTRSCRLIFQKVVDKYLLFGIKLIE